MGMNAADGTHTRVHDWAADKLAGIKITASRFDAENDDFSSSLSNMVARDGQSTVAANIPFSGFKITGSTAASALKDVLIYADVQTNRTNFLTVSEATSQNSISGVAQVAIGSYSTGAPAYWIPGFNNTSGVTLTISGLSARSMLAGGVAMTSGMLLSGVPAMVISDGSGFHLMNPQRAPINFVPTAGFQENSVTLTKMVHNVQGSIITQGASGTPQFLAPGTTGLPLVTKGASANAIYEALAAVGLASDSVIEAKILNRAVTINKLGSDTTQGAIISHTASGAPAYIVATTSGYPLVTKGASADAAFQQLGATGIGDNEITLAKWNHETVQGAVVYTGAAGTPTYLAPGTSGQVLQSGGASANIAWATVGGVADNSITLAKLEHNIQGTIITQGAAGAPQYLAPGTTGLPLVTKGASANAIYEALAEVGIADGAVGVAKLKAAETPQGAVIVTGAGGVPAYLATGTDGQVLTSAGASANPAWEAAGGGDSWAQATPIATASGTSITFGSLPAGLSMIFVHFDGTSTDSTGNIDVQIGDGGGIETGGYTNTMESNQAGTHTFANSSDAFSILTDATGDTVHGHMVLARLDSGHEWTMSHTMRTTGNGNIYGAGSKDLSAELTQVLIKTSSGNFDAGRIGLSYI